MRKNAVDRGRRECERRSSLEDGIETFSENLLFGKTARIVYELCSIRSGIVEQFLRNIYNSNESFGYQLIRIKLFRVINYHYHLFYRCYS